MHLHQGKAGAILIVETLSTGRVFTPNTSSEHSISTELLTLQCDNPHVPASVRRTANHPT